MVDIKIYDDFVNTSVVKDKIFDPNSGAKSSMTININSAVVSNYFFCGLLYIWF